MKAPAFWYRRVGLTAHLLSPLSEVYRVGGYVRRAFAQSYRSKIPVICVGNIVAGGSGKTPTALAMAALLKQQGLKPVFVTRGYGGTEGGPVRVDRDVHTADQVGDEALLLARVAPVWIGRYRVAAIQKAETEATHIILDDGLQNPHIQPSLSFLVVDAASGFGNGYVMPAGPLRETLADALPRIHALVLVGTERSQALPQSLEVPVYKAHLEPDMSSGLSQREKYFAFAGIGRPEKFYNVCRRAGLQIVGTKDFPDHYPFSEQEISELHHRATRQGAMLLTTEKDAVRVPLSCRGHIKILPVTLVFDDIEALSRLLLSSR